MHLLQWANADVTTKHRIITSKDYYVFSASKALLVSVPCHKDVHASQNDYLSWQHIDCKGCERKKLSSCETHTVKLLHCQDTSFKPGGGGGGKNGCMHIFTLSHCVSTADRHLAECSFNVFNSHITAFIHHPENVFQSISFYVWPIINIALPRITCIIITAVIVYTSEKLVWEASF